MFPCAGDDRWISIAVLDDDIVLYPGHRYSIASSATMGAVKQSNYIFDQVLGT